ncbi:MAG: Multifunctional cyclase-dehydratase-3-O-methyl transferase TcmN [Chlamydiales bacterium]|nr:Multifunctional cyclase-dehydratase-3-O-methyl transferase TcmN [Chlamydiales bacterium]MCH9634874.1 Multifunctional cyclase-dehydratase-3-O-methyl transferase TcmN [Chlamydiales bacterium]MCH9703859.1 methyltransferase [Chlamydiota bacterium]
MENLIVSSSEDLLLLGNAYVASRALHIVADLRIADLFADDSPKSVETLSEKMSFCSVTLERIFRVLCPFGIFCEHENGTFSITDIGRQLQSDHPSKMRDRLFCEVCRWSGVGEMGYTLKTGSPGFLNHYQTGYFDYIAEKPELQKGFDEHMRAVSAEENPIIAQALPLKHKKCCVDVGGGEGGLVRAILDAHPHANSAVFDLPNVANEALTELSEQYKERFEVFTGSFFDALPFQSDALVLKRVLHDWDDAKSTAILSRCRDALTEDGELYIVESILTGKEDSSLLRLFDLLLRTVFGGIERKADAYESLLKQADLRLRKIIPTKTGMSILIATR